MKSRAPSGVDLSRIGVSISTKPARWWASRIAVDQPGAKQQPLQHRPAADVEVAVLEAQALVDRGVGLVDVERRRLGLVQDLDLAGSNLDLAGVQARRSRSRRAGGRPCLGPPARTRCGARLAISWAARRLGRVDDDLGDAVAVAQVEEDQVRRGRGGGAPSRRRGRRDPRRRRAARRTVTSRYGVARLKAASGAAGGWAGLTHVAHRSRTSGEAGRPVAHPWWWLLRRAGQLAGQVGQGHQALSARLEVLELDVALRQLVADDDREVGVLPGRPSRAAGPACAAPARPGPRAPRRGAGSPHAGARRYRPDRRPTTTASGGRLRRGRRRVSSQRQEHAVQAEGEADAGRRAPAEQLRPGRRSGRRRPAPAAAPRRRGGSTRTRCGCSSRGRGRASAPARYGTPSASRCARTAAKWAAHALAQAIGHPRRGRR